jgi:hypothetical protein
VKTKDLSTIDPHEMETMTEEEEEYMGILT